MPGADATVGVIPIVVSAVRSKQSRGQSQNRGKEGTLALNAARISHVQEAARLSDWNPHKTTLRDRSGQVAVKAAPPRSRTSPGVSEGQRSVASPFGPHSRERTVARFSCCSQRDRPWPCPVPPRFPRAPFSAAPRWGAPRRGHAHLVAPNASPRAPPWRTPRRSRLWPRLRCRPPRGLAARQ